MVNYVFTTEDVVNRIYSVKSSELPYEHKATILLKNHDGYFTSIDLTGLYLTISWGALVSSVPDYCTDPTLVVFFQRNISMEGELLTELICYNIWELLKIDSIISGGQRINASGPITGDFNTFDIVLNSAGTGSAIVLDQGYQHLIVRDLTGIVAGDTITAVSNGSNLVVLSVQSSTSTVGSNIGWAGTMSIEDIIAQLTAGKMDHILDSEDANNLYTGTGTPPYLPNYMAELGTPVLNAIKDLIDRTKNVLRLRYQATSPFLECHSLLPTSVSDYDYFLIDPGHKFITEVYSKSLVLPNKVYIVGAELDDTGVLPVGYDSNAASVAKVGEYARIVRVALLETEHTAAVAEATKYAESLMAQQALESNSGTAIVPMNSAQELWDYISITDDRLGVTIYGWVTGLKRQYHQEAGIFPEVDDNGRNHFSMEISVGNQSALTMGRFHDQPGPEYHGGPRLRRTIPQQIVITTIYDCWYWDVAADGEPPTNWMDSAYDHTSPVYWGNAVTGDDSVYGPVSGAQSIWAPGVASPQEVCFIQTFNIDQGEAVRAYLDIKWCDELIGVWINGHQVIESQPGTVLNIGTYIDVGIMPPGPNKIAVRARNLSTYPDYFVSYMLTIDRMEEVSGTQAVTAASPLMSSGSLLTSNGDVIMVP